MVTKTVVEMTSVVVVAAKTNSPLKKRLQRLFAVQYQMKMNTGTLTLLPSFILSHTRAHINTITYTNKTKPMSIIIYTADNAIANMSKVANDSINSQKRLKTIILFSILLQSVLHASLLSVDARVHAFESDRSIQHSSQHCVRSKR